MSPSRCEVQGVGKADARGAGEGDDRAGRAAGKEASFPRQLSGGQQQRVGIARSLSVEPELWFLDEPFSALDPLIRREMQDEFMRLQSVLQKTIVFITHDFDEAIRLADRIAVMKDGAIVQAGTPEDIVPNPAPALRRRIHAQRAEGQGRQVGVGHACPAKGRPLSARRRPATCSVSEAAPLFSPAPSGRIAVVDAAGRHVGALEREVVVGLMMQG